MQGSSGELSTAQRRQWQQTYRANPDMYGMHPSGPAQYAARAFRTSGASTILELGAGHGRDALFLAESGFHVVATDFSPTGLEQLRDHADERGLSREVRTLAHDVREPLPLADNSADAVFAHMLLCMALSTEGIHTIVGEVARVLTPGGLLVYTVRHTGDAHYGAGVEHGDNIYEHGGFAVHFFDRALVDSLAHGWNLEDVHAFEEGDLPRRLWRITRATVA